MKPLAVDLCCGLGGWSEGLIAEGWDVVGFDIERHHYGNATYPGQLVLQDIVTLNGYQFRGKVQLIVASPPCTEYSYMAMPWTRSKQIAQALRGRGDFPQGYGGSRTTDELNRLFNACVRIGREAECPVVIENVCGAQPWIGRSRWRYGSFYLWGDVPALMPIVTKRGQKVTGFRFDGSGRSFQSAAVKATKNDGGSWFEIAHNTTSGHGQNPDGRLNGVKRSAAEDDGSERDHPEAFGWKKPRTSSHSSARKAAAAQIAQIPETLARHIAKAWKPE